MSVINRWRQNSLVTIYCCWPFQACANHKQKFDRKNMKKHAANCMTEAGDCLPLFGKGPLDLPVLFGCWIQVELLCRSCGCPCPQWSNSSRACFPTESEPVFCATNLVPYFFIGKSCCRFRNPSWRKQQRLSSDEAFDLRCAGNISNAMNNHTQLVLRTYPYMMKHCCLYRCYWP